MQSSRVLFIDDSPTQLAAVSAALTEAGFPTKVAQSAAEATPHLNSVDIVLIDYNMPGATGFEVLAQLREKLPPDATSPAFFLYTINPDSAKQHRDAGFDGLFVLKGDVKALVKQMLSVARLIRIRGLRRSA